jgi:tetratricopeptide (TPR) repeat protein
MKTPAITIFVVCILILCLVLAFYNYRKHGARPNDIIISKYDAEKLKKDKNSGEKQVYMENYEAAIKEYTKAIKISPTDSILYNDRGTAYYHLGLENANPPLSEDELDYGIEADARHTEAPEALAIVKDKLKETDSGIITAVVDNESTSEQIENSIRSMGHYVHAEEETENGEKEYWLTIIVGKTKEAFLNAQRDYLKAIDIQSVKDSNGRKYSNYSTASRNLGTLYFRMGRKKEAMEQLRRALELEPTDEELRELIGSYE